MPLLFNGKELTNYDKLIEHLIPKGKDKTVTFMRINARPYKVLGAKGYVNKAGGEKQIATFATVVLPEWEGQKNVEGVLQYYRTNNKTVVRGGGGIADNFEPKFITFSRNVRTVDAIKDKALLFFLHFIPENKANEGKSNVKPTYYMVAPAAGSKARVASADNVLNALNKLRKLKDDHPKILQQVYQACGFTDWDIHITKTEQDWDSVLDPLYAIAQQKDSGNGIPGATKILELINDDMLANIAKVTVALDKGVLSYQGGAFFWGKEVQLAGGATDRKITEVPHGMQGNEDARDWFAEWLRTQGAVTKQLDIEMSAAKLKAA